MLIYEHEKRKSIFTNLFIYKTDYKRLLFCFIYTFVNYFFSSIGGYK